MIQSAFGNMTISNATGSPRFFWSGHELLHVLKSSFIKNPAQHRVALHVRKPESVVPALSTEEIAQINDIYNQMTADGVFITREG